MLRSLNAFGDAAEAHAFRDLEYRFGKRRFLGALIDSVNEGLVDLQDVDGQSTEVSERRVAGPEVVECKANADGF